MFKTEPTEDVLARGALEREIAGLIPDDGTGDADMGTAKVLGEMFRSVQFETQTTKVKGGGTVALRRVVAVGAWEVDPAAFGGN